MFRITIHASGNFDLYGDGHRVASFVYLEDCMQFITMNYNKYDCFDVTSGDTGEVYFTVEKE